MKRGLTFVVCLSLVLIFSLSIVSAFSFSDFWNKITGHATSVSLPCGSNQKIGDVDGNGIIDNTDANLVAQIYVGSISAPSNICCADANKDGKIDVVDSLFIAQIVQGLKPSSGVCNPTTNTTCSDGTLGDKCSITKPKYCTNDGRDLIDYCTSCGCSSGQCQIDGSCATLTCTDNSGDWADVPFLIKGTATLFQDGQIIKKLSDYCEREDLLIKPQCFINSSGLADIGKSQYFCPLNNKCVNGACVSSVSNSCSDSDGGMNFYINGSAISYDSFGNSAKAEDKCYLRSSTGDMLILAAGNFVQ